MKHHPGVSIANESKLREAADRLLAQHATVTDGALTMANLCKEAGVSRATMNRSQAANDFRQQTRSTDRRSPAQQAHERQVTVLQSELRAVKRELGNALRRLDAAASVIAGLHLENQILTGRTDNVMPLANSVKPHSMRPKSQFSPGHGTK